MVYTGSGAETINEKLRLVEEQILSTYGDTVSISQKAKSLLKFGRNNNVGTAAATIMTLNGSEVAEAYVNRNLITHIASSSTSDIMTIKVEGHTVGDDLSVSSITQTAGTATLTTSSAHGLSVDGWVYIEGANESEYNGIVQIATVPSSTTFTYSVDSGATSPATGTITATDQNKTFVVQNVSLNGRTKTALTTPLARATRMFVPSQNKATDLDGVVYIAQDVTFTNGVPQTDSAIHLIIPDGKNQTEKCSTSLSQNDYWIITNFYSDALDKASSFATVELQIREIGGVFRERATISASNIAQGVLQFDPPLIAPKNSDVRLQAIADNAGTDVSGGIQGYLAVVTS